MQLVCQIPLPEPSDPSCVSFRQQATLSLYSPNVKESLMTAMEQKQLLADVEAFCQEIRPIEELCYAEHQFNDQVVPLARKHNILGMLSPTELGGRSADAVTYLRALARIGREGTGVRTFFSGHISIGSYPILSWGTAE